MSWFCGCLRRQETNQEVMGLFPAPSKLLSLETMLWENNWKNAVLKGVNFE